MPIIKSRLKLADLKIKTIIPVLLVLAACSKPKIYSAVGANQPQDPLAISKMRARELNSKERGQIEQWIENQKENFYSTKMNYWTNIQNLDHRPVNVPGTVLSYSYDVYDFTLRKIYPHSIVKEDQIIGKFNDLPAVEDVLLYLKPGEEATLLVPSALAFGATGDGSQIQNDVPLIIKIKVKPIAKN